MKCPKPGCNSEKYRVTDCRPGIGKNFITSRRRECVECGTRFRTEERIVAKKPGGDHSIIISSFFEIDTLKEMRSALADQRGATDGVIFILDKAIEKTEKGEFE